jgi:transposase
MAYREVIVVDVKEVIRLWLRGMRKKPIARQVGLDPQTVRKYLSAAEELGLVAGSGEQALNDGVMAALMSVLRPELGRPRGEGWHFCESQRGYIQKLLRREVRLTKVRKLLSRNRHVRVSYATLRRFAIEELSFSEKPTGIPVQDGEPGQELQVDTGWMTLLGKEGMPGRQRFRAWIFTAVVSRYRFVYPVLRETTETAIEACEAAWAFFGGVFGVLIPDNTKAIVAKADPLSPRITEVFREYSQARGFVIDPARAKRPKDKARVENSVQVVREDCFKGETLFDVDGARGHARWWCLEDYGQRVHGTTQRAPRDHFEAEERGLLLPEPAERYDMPSWSEPRVNQDQLAWVARSLYSVPTVYVGKTLRARADSQTVRFYLGYHEAPVKTHPRMAPGKPSVDAADYPSEKAIYAFRNGQALVERAQVQGEAVGRFAAALLEGPLPWARMRHVKQLLRLCEKYGAARVEETSRIALGVEMIDVVRLELMLKLARPANETVSDRPAPSKVVPIARYLRPASHFALRRAAAQQSEGGER